MSSKRDIFMHHARSMEKGSDIYESIILIDTLQYHFCHSYNIKLKKTIFIANMTFTCFIWVKGISNRKKTNGGQFIHVW